VIATLRVFFKGEAMRLLRERTISVLCAALALIGAAAVTPSAGAPLSFTTAADGTGRFQTADGQKHFLVGVYDTGVGPFDSVEQAEAILFDTNGDLRSTRSLENLPALNTYLNYHRGHDTKEQLWNLMGALKTHGLLWLQTTNCFAGHSYLEPEPDFSADQPGFLDGLFGLDTTGATSQLAGYYIMDECENGLIPETQTHHANLTTKHQQLGVSAPMNLAVGFAAPDREPGFWTRPALNCDPTTMVPEECDATWTPTASLFGTDPYPLYGREFRYGYPNFLVADYVARLRQWVRRSDPIVAVLQIFKFGGGGRLPTKGEMRMHVASAAVEGVQGVFWWELGVNGLRSTANRDNDVKRMLGYLKDVTDELKDIEPGLLAPADQGLGGIATACDRPSTIAWRRKAIVQNKKVIERYSYATLLWYDQEDQALAAGQLSRSPMLHDASSPSHDALRPDAQCSDIRTRASFDSAGNRGYLVAYNYTSATVTGNFVWNGPVTLVAVKTNTGTTNLPGVSGAGPVLFSDTLGPYEARVYVITP
jgi:hypothetical protein